MPKVLLKKLISTSLFIPGCFIAGFVFYITTKDVVLFKLSIVLCIATIIKTIGMYRTFHNKNYNVFKGTCISIKPHIIDRWSDVCFIINGEETMFRFDKNIQFNIDTNYRLYFRKEVVAGIMKGNKYIRSALAVENFLGRELVPKQQSKQY